MSARKPYFTEAELLTLDALLNGAQPSAMTAHERARAERVRAKLREYVEARAARKASRAKVNS